MNKLTINLLLISISVGSVIISGCSKRNDSGSSMVTIKGSDTMVHLVSSWAEKYMALNPDAEISVTGGGSGTGIAAILNNTTDIAASSRSIKEKESTLAESKGIGFTRTVIAKDGIAVIVNIANEISALSLESLRLIFTGEVTNWKQVGGADKEIVVLSRESNSGTHVFFQKLVLRKDDYTQGALLMPSSSSLTQTVNDNENAIGYVGLGYADNAGDNVKTLSIITPDGNVIPSEETVKSGEYPIARPLLFYVNANANGKVKAFIDYCLSEEGQKIVSEIGYVPIAD